jgi:hypothetical protein
MLISLLILTCLHLPISAQTPEACRAAMQHLILPPTAESPVAHPQGAHYYNLTPLDLLFSLGGVDVYSYTTLRSSIDLDYINT